MSNADVEAASGIAKWLTQREASGPGDMENAWRRLEARYGLPWRIFWALRYRPPNSIASHVFERLRAAYKTECERQMRKLQNEITITDPNYIGKAQALVREAHEILSGEVK